METQTTLISNNINLDSFENDVKTKVFHPRLAWMMYYQQVHNIKKVCEKFGISRKTFYKWWWRYYKSGYQAVSLFDKSKKPHKSPSATPIAIIQKIINAKEITGYGPRKLKNYLLENLNIKISERTIWKILKKYQIINPNSFESDGVLCNRFLPGDEVYVTTYSLTPINNSKIFIISAFDISTRLRISKILHAYNKTELYKFLQFIIDKFPFKIKKIKFTEQNLLITRNDFQDLTRQIQLSFTNNYEKELIETEIHKYDKKNFWEQAEYDSLEKLESNFNNYIRLQNNHTSHETLGGLTPLQKLRNVPFYRNIIYFDYS